MENKKIKDIYTNLNVENIDALLHQIEIIAPTSIQSIVDVMGRTEDIRFSPNQKKLAILEAYVPKMMDEREVRFFLAENGVAEMSLKDAMKFSMQVLDGKADKALVSKIIKELLAK